MTTYNGHPKELYKLSLEGLHNYSLHIFSRDGEIPDWINQEINKVDYIINNWENLSNDTNE
jgi:hypothetical protein